MENNIIASYAISNTIALGVTDIDNETVRVILTTPDHQKRFARELHTDGDGKIYFNLYGVPYCIDEFIRCDF
jgi:hypothetical protein